MKTVAATRGVTNFFMGSVPRARMASICSVTIIDPNSLAMPEEFRPATIKLVSTGPNSRTMEAETSCPTKESDPKRSNADCIRLPYHVSEIKRLLEQIGHRLHAKQDVILNRLDFQFGEIGGRGEFHAARKSPAVIRRCFPETIAEKAASLQRSFILHPASCRFNSSIV